MPRPLPRHKYALSVFAVIALSALAGTAFAGPESEMAVASAEAELGESSTPIPGDAIGDAVVCEAGCRGDRPEIVYVRPSAEARPRTDGVLTSTSASNLIECLAGCYDTPRTYEAIAPQTGGEEPGNVALEATTLEQRAPTKREPFSPIR